MSDENVLGLADLEDFDLEKERRLAQQTDEAIAKLSEWIPNALRQLADISSLPPERRKVYSERVQGIKQDLIRLIEHENERIRRESWLIYLRHKFSQRLGPAGAKSLLMSLVSGNFLKEDVRGYLKAHGKAYVVSSKSLFGEQETAEITRVFEDFKKGVLKEHENFLRAQAEGGLTPQEFRDGKPGIFGIYVPPEYVEDGDFWRKGGYLLVRSDGERIHPQDATNSIGVGVREARELGVWLKLESLSWNYAPTPRDLPGEMVKKLHLLWNVLYRGLRSVEKARRAQEIEQELAGKTTITRQEFLLQGKAGVCLITFPTWRVKDEQGETGSEISPLAFLVERLNGGDEGASIRVVEAPGASGEFLSECREEYPDGKPNFFGCPHPLRDLLQAAWGRASREFGQTN